MNESKKIPKKLAGKKATTLAAKSSGSNTYPFLVQQGDAKASKGVESGGVLQTPPVTARSEGPLKQSNSVENYYNKSSMLNIS